MKIKDRKIVVINQAVNYLTIGLTNEFADKFEKVALITGSIHVQGENLNKDVNISYILKWKEEHGFTKAMNYFKALLSMWYLLMTKYRNYEVFFVSVPPMGYLLNLILPHRFSMIIWDVYPDGLKITGMKETNIIYRIWARLNRISFRKAFCIYTIGDRMADLLEKYVRREKLLIQPIWSIFQSNSKINKEDNPFIKEHKLQGKFIVQYSGNIGLTHKVETLLTLAERMKSYNYIIFQIIGRGPRKNKLQRLVKEKNLKNCQFLPFQTDEMFPYSLSAADLGVVILDELTSKGSVPSKSYNLMSFGIPSLYIASEDSELNDYAKKYGHAKCFRENDLMKVEDFILKLSKNNELYNELALNSLDAAKHFRRDNARKIIDYYLDPPL